MTTSYIKDGSGTRQDLPPIIIE
jgi:hypothetical protein